MENEPLEKTGEKKISWMLRVKKALQIILIVMLAVSIVVMVALLAIPVGTIVAALTAVFSVVLCIIVAFFLGAIILLHLFGYIKIDKK